MARSLSHPSTAATTATTATTATATLTLNDARPRPADGQRSLVLLLSRPKKKVTWKEGTVDNEFLQRKSSKKCCVFHKQRPFDEDDSDVDEDDSSGADTHGHRHPGNCSDGGHAESCCSAN